jgi:phosphoribosylformimino-5-aminoimidazole carboxamide ribotide isomerase
MDLIPAIDLLDGKAVRLRQGSYDEVTIYHDRPAELAREWRGRAPRLHVVDLEGARSGRAVQRELVAAIAAAFGPGVQAGGGIRSRQVAADYLALGVERVVLGTVAVSEPELVRELARAHPDRVIVAVDARQGMVFTDGWENAAQARAIDLVRALDGLPIAGVLYTDIERDGTEVGPNLAETSRLARSTQLPVIASGGVGTLDHLRALARAEGPISGAIVGRALHERRFSLEEAGLAVQGG